MSGRLVLVAALAAGSAAAAHAGERIATLPGGRYLCELPGDATGPASRPVNGQWFDIVNPSSYVAAEGSGTYLLTGKTVLFTRGPMRGAKFERRGERALRRLDLAGEHANLRCVRTGRSTAP